MTESLVNVLVVEDEIIAQLMAQQILVDLKSQVEIAKNGLEALEKIKLSKYQIIFLDLGLPDMNGLSVVSKIRETENINQETPIILLTAHTTETMKNKCIEHSGISKYLLKPLTFENATSIFSEFLKT